MGPDPRPRPQWAKSSTRSRKKLRGPSLGSVLGQGHFTLGLDEKRNVQTLQFQHGPNDPEA